LADATFHNPLLTYDRDPADNTREAGCACDGVLHSAKYPRKLRPRLGSSRFGFGLDVLGSARKENSSARRLRLVRR
jgi:hypothetical protein